MLTTFSIFSQDGGCATVASSNPQEIEGDIIIPRTIQFYFHIVRDDFGQGGHTNQEVDDQINLLFNDLAEWSITGIEVGRDIIKSSYYLNFTLSKFDNLIQINSHTDAIDVYFTGSYGSSKAKDILSSSCVITKNGIGNKLITHEVGHCLGLYHTHHNKCEDDGTYPACLQCGDYVCDTPPDPGLDRNFFNGVDGNVNQDCEFVSNNVLPPPWGGEWDPDTRNIMSYTPYPCADWFTLEQAEKMHSYLTNDPLLINTYYFISPPANLNWSNQNSHPKLQWNAVSNSSLMGYKIYRNLSGCGINCGYYNHIATVSASQTNYIDQTVTVGGKFATADVYYYVTAYTNTNKESVNSNRVTVPTDMLNKESKIFENNDLLKNQLDIYPNPFNPATKILLSLEKNSRIQLSVFNILGKKVITLYDGYKNYGTHEIQFISNQLSSGMYLLSLLIYNQTKPIHLTKRITVLK